MEGPFLSQISPPIQGLVATAKDLAASQSLLGEELRNEEKHLQQLTEGQSRQLAAVVWDLEFKQSM